MKDLRLVLNELQALSDVALRLDQILFDEHRADQLVNVSVLVKLLELLRDGERPKFNEKEKSGAEETAHAERLASDNPTSRCGESGHTFSTMSFSLYCWTNCWRLLMLRLRSSGDGNER